MGQEVKDYGKMQGNPRACRTCRANAWQRLFKMEKPAARLQIQFSEINP